MRRGPSKVWTTRRKWAGNLAPLPFLLFPAVAGALLFSTGSLWLGGALVVSALPLGWIGLNLFGGTGSRAMRLELARILAGRGERVTAETPFVGFATPAFRSAIDAHEEIGFLLMDAERLRFVTDVGETVVTKGGIASVGYAANLHSILGLGRWVEVKGSESGREYRLFFEPRTEPSMRANRAATESLRDRIEAWRKR